MESDSSQGKSYYVEVGGQQYGPADMQTLSEWKASGRITRDSILVDAVTQQRVSAGSVAELYPPESGPTAPPFMSPPAASPGSRRSFPMWAVALLVVGGLCVFGTVVLAAILFPVFRQARHAADRTIGMSRLKQLSLGVLMYSSDHDDRYPLAMESALAAKPSVMPYVKSDEIFVSANPKGGEILGNAALSGRLAVDVLDPVETGMFYDSQPWAQNRGIAAYTDGHVKLTTMAEIEQSLKRPLKALKAGKK